MGRRDYGVKWNNNNNNNKKKKKNNNVLWLTGVRINRPRGHVTHTEQSDERFQYTAQLQSAV